jgi:hypothetical protein
MESFIDKFMGILMPLLLQAMKSELLKAGMDRWIKKHLTPEELLNETNDLLKFIKEKL